MSRRDGREWVPPPRQSLPTSKSRWMTAPHEVRNISLRTVAVGRGIGRHVRQRQEYRACLGFSGASVEGNAEAKTHLQVICLEIRRASVRVGCCNPPLAVRQQERVLGERSGIRLLKQRGPELLDRARRIPTIEIGAAEAEARRGGRGIKVHRLL